MKLFSKFFLLMLTGMLVISCQKELNFDLSGASAGTLKADAASICLPSTVNGVYQADSTLGADNYIDVQVDVAVTGTYTVQSDTVNGYSFKGTGTFGNAGLNTVRIYGSGEPLLPGVNTFIISYDSTFCLIDVNVIAGNTPQQAVYTFGGAGGTCTGAVLNGTYMETLPLTPANTVTLQVSVTTPGTYNISTTNLNGVSFSGSGVLAVGSTSVTLSGSGTPTAAGTFNYPATGSGSTCSFSVTFDPLAAPATYTLVGAPGGCTGATLGGTFTVGVDANPSNTVQVTANVTTPGSYSITTPTVNGISYTASGVFVNAGNNPVTLYATGIPAAAGSFNYDVTGGGNICTFSVSVSASPTDYITCKIDGVATTFNVNATAGLDNSTGFPILSIDGSSTTSSIDPSISLGILKIMGGSIVSGTYNVNQLASGITVSCDYNDAASVNFFAGTDALNQSQTPAFTIVITSITATRVSGTFTGPVKENNGAGPAGKSITEGAFNVPIQ
jgi:hypothetical protein